MVNSNNRQIEGCSKRFGCVGPDAKTSADTCYDLETYTHWSHVFYTWTSRKCYTIDVLGYTDISFGERPFHSEWLRQMHQRSPMETGGKDRTMFLWWACIATMGCMPPYPSCLALTVSVENKQPEGQTSLTVHSA